MLGLDNSRQAVSRLDADEISDVIISDTSSNGVQQSRKVSIINESGLYSLILTSRKPEAKQFKKWVTSEVLPALRKTGSYTVNPKSAIELFEMQVAIAKEHEARLAAQDASIRRIEARQTAIEARQTGMERGSDYFTVIGYANYMKVAPPSNSEASVLGKRAASLSNAWGYEIGKTSDPRYGQVNTYHVSVLEIIFRER